VAILPEIDALVVLRDQYGGEYRSRVVAVSAASLRLQRPADLPGALTGARLLVIWPDRTALWVQPVVVDAARSDGEWVAALAGQPWREEIREYGGAALDATVQVRYAAGDSELIADGLVIELSEAAVRCAVPNEHTGVRVAQTPVRVDLALASDLFEFTGVVMAGRPAGRSDLRLEVVILFDRPVPDAEKLRIHLAS
jgi:hypothetical protein